MTLTEHFKQEERIATNRGAADFFAGVHLNPYSWSKEGDLFRAWIVGYQAAKATTVAQPNEHYPFPQVKQ